MELLRSLVNSVKPFSLISTTVIFKGLYFKSIGLDIKDFPSSYNLYKNEISLPIYNDLSIESVEYVCEKLIEIVNEIIE